MLSFTKALFIFGTVIKYHVLPTHVKYQLSPLQNVIICILTLGTLCFRRGKGSKTELESDEDVLMRREKQVVYGKDTSGYRRYLQMVPK